MSAMIDGVTNPVHPGVQAPSTNVASQHRDARPDSGEEVRASTDKLELSEAAQERLQPDPMPVRTELVERVRAEIAAGTYLSDDKLDGAIDRLREEVFAAA